MSKPKIDRRCRACGASIREAAAFCPQCGEELGSQDLAGKPTTTVVTTPLVELASGEGEAYEKGPTESVAAKLETTEGVATPQETGGSKAAFREGQDGKVRQAAVAKVRDKIQRATTLARDVEGDMKHRVQKVRQISSVVLDEAGYDPSLRFILVAAALFILFLFVLLLNKLIG